jgi:hypothetical protein
MMPPTEKGLRSSATFCISVNTRWDKDNTACTLGSNKAALVRRYGHPVNVMRLILVNAHSGRRIR